MGLNSLKEEYKFIDLKNNKSINKFRKKLIIFK